MGPRLSSRARFSSTDKRVSTFAKENGSRRTLRKQGPITQSAALQLAKSVRGISLRQVRLVSGMVLFGYLVSHFLNHALGNVSMEALARGVYIHTLFWQFLPIAVVFYTACLVHAGLGIWALYERRQFKWKAMEPIQLVLGLSIPALIIAHIVGVRLGQALFEHEKLYPQELYVFFVAGRTSSGRCSRSW